MNRAPRDRGVWAVASLAWVLCACGLPPAAKTARATWHELRTPRFALLTDGDPKRAHELVVDLERFHQVMLATTNAEEVEAAPPLRIFLTKDRESFVSLTHTGAGTKGLFGATSWGNYAIMDGSVAGGGSYSIDMRGVLFHEYTHYIMAVRGARVPSWYNEGLAEYMAATRFRDDGSYTVGCPPKHRTGWLNALSWTPMQQVFGAENVASIVGGVHAPSDGYAQSWYAVHYFSANSERKQQLSEYLRAWADHTPDEVAVQRDLRMSFAQLDTLLQNYAEHNRFDCLAIRPAKPLAVPEVQQHVLSPSEAHYQIGELVLATVGPTAAVFDLLEQAAHVEPNSALPWLAFTRAHWLKAQRSEVEADAELVEAERSLQQARQRGGETAEALALEGHIQRLQAKRAAAFGKPFADALTASRKAYRSAIKQDDACAEAYSGLGMTYLIEDNGSQEAQVALEAAAYLSPLYTEIPLALAKIHIGRHNALQAIAALEYVLRWSGNEDERKQAKSALESLRTDAASPPQQPAPVAPAPAAPAPAEPAAPKP